MKNIQFEIVYCDEIPSPHKEKTFYISEKYKVAIHLCACGCGAVTVTPFNHQRFPDLHWELIKETDGTVSLSPSVGNQNQPCGTHYWFKHNVAIIDNK
jgi:Family of unknown function (DUF6527)